LDVAVLGVVDDVGAAICQVIEYLHEVAADVEERRLAPCRDLELTLTAEGLGLLNERIDLGRSLENLYKSVPITIVVDDEEILEQMHVARHDDADNLGFVVVFINLGGVAPQIVVPALRVVIMNNKLIFGVIDGDDVRVAVAVDVAECHDFHAFKSVVLGIIFIETEFRMIEAYLVKRMINLPLLGLFQK